MVLRRIHIVTLSTNLTFELQESVTSSRCALTSFCIWHLPGDQRSYIHTIYMSILTRGVDHTSRAHIAHNYIILYIP